MWRLTCHDIDPEMDCRGRDPYGAICQIPEDDREGRESGNTYDRILSHSGRHLEVVWFASEQDATTAAWRFPTIEDLMQALDLAILRKFEQQGIRFTIHAHNTNEPIPLELL